MSRYGFDSDFRQGERDFERYGRYGYDERRFYGYEREDRDYQDGFIEARRADERRREEREQEEADELDLMQRRREAEYEEQELEYQQQAEAKEDDLMQRRREAAYEEQELEYQQQAEAEEDELEDQRQAEEGPADDN